MWHGVPPVVQSCAQVSLAAHTQSSPSQTSLPLSVLQAQKRIETKRRMGFMCP